MRHRSSIGRVDSKDYLPMPQQQERLGRHGVSAFYDLSWGVHLPACGRRRVPHSSARLFHTPAAVRLGRGKIVSFPRRVVIDKALAQTSGSLGDRFPGLARRRHGDARPRRRAAGGRARAASGRTLWTTSTATQSGYGLRDHDAGLCAAGTAVGNGARLVPGSTAAELPQILNVHTGEAATLSNPTGMPTPGRL